MNLCQDDFNSFSDDVVAFQSRLLDKYFERHTAAKGSSLLSDRSALDQLAYLDWQVHRGRLNKCVLDEEIERAFQKGLHSLYESTHFVLMSPQEGLCRDDGTRMQSDFKGLLDLHEAFVHILKRCGFRFRRFEALNDDPGDIVKLFERVNHRAH